MADTWDKRLKIIDQSEYLDNETVLVSGVVLPVFGMHFNVVHDGKTALTISMVPTETNTIHIVISTDGDIAAGNKVWYTSAGKAQHMLTVE